MKQLSVVERGSPRIINDCDIDVNIFVKTRLGRPSVDCMNIFHININGLVNKFDELKHHFVGCAVDVLAISETHLKPSILQSRIRYEGFRVLRNDRPGRTKDGGICLYVRSDLQCNVISVSNAENEIKISLVSFCVNEANYFTYKNQCYLFMGSPLSPILSDLVMEDILYTMMGKLPNKPSFIKKYVDDIITSLYIDVGGKNFRINKLNRRRHLIHDGKRE